MWEINMNPGQASPCIFHQSELDATGFVHGDDFVIVTSRKHSKEIEDHLRNQWEVEVQTFGPGEHATKQIRARNRILTWEVAGIEHDADHRQDRLVSTPGEDVNEDENEPEL